MKRRSGPSYDRSLSLELLDRDLEPIAVTRRHRNRHPVSEPDRLRVGDPIRCGEQHLVARIEERLKREVTACFPPLVMTTCEGSTTNPDVRAIAAATAERRGGRPAAAV